MNPKIEVAAKEKNLPNANLPAQDVTPIDTDEYFNESPGQKQPRLTDRDGKPLESLTPREAFAEPIKPNLKPRAPIEVTEEDAPIGYIASPSEEICDEYYALLGQVWKREHRRRKARGLPPLEKDDEGRVLPPGYLPQDMSTVRRLERICYRLLEIRKSSSHYDHHDQRDLLSIEHDILFLLQAIVDVPSTHSRGYRPEVKNSKE
jgi:hypothetical protein